MPIAAQDDPTKKSTLITDLLITSCICYVTGRQIRNAPLIPEKGYSLTGLAQDLLIGFAVNSCVTICHEGGHALAYKIVFDVWPKNVTVGSSNPNDRELFSLCNGKMSVRGYSPIEAVTTFREHHLAHNKKRSALVFAAGALCGAGFYYALKYALKCYCSNGQPMTYLYFCDAQPLLELAGGFLTVDVPGTDAYNIATALTK